MSPSTPLDIPCKHEGEISVLNASISRIEDTLQDLKDLLASNAALEEQAVSMRASLKEQAERLHHVELALARSDGSHVWIDKIIWTVVALGIGLLIGGGGNLIK